MSEDAALYPPDDLPDDLDGWSMARLLLALETRGETTLRQVQDAHFVRTVGHHARHSSQFRQRLIDAGLVPADLDRVSAVDRLPVLCRADVQSAGPGLFAGQVPFDHLPVRESSTSGSTGQPVVIRRTRINGLLNEAATLRDHGWWQRPRNGGRITMVRPQFSRLREVPAGPIDPDNVAQQIPITTDVREQARQIGGFAPQVLLVYPGNLAALLEIWQADGGAPASLRHLKTIGETVSDALRTRARQVLGLPIEDSYSSEEMGMIAVQCPASGQYHVMAESHLVEVLRDDGSPCGPGETGQVVVTDLHNLATPMIRYAIGDWAEVGGPCPCGRNLPTLRRILGRERNLVRLPDGRRHWPLVGFQRFAEVAAVRQYQVVQHSLSDVELRVVADAGLQSAQRERLADIVRDALGHPFEVRVSEHAVRLPPGANGKFEEFVCRVPA